MLCSVDFARKESCRSAGQKNLGAAIRTFDQSFPGQLEISPAVGTLLLTLKLGCFYGIEHALRPIDIATKQAAADELIEIALDLVLGRVELEHEIRNRDLTPG